MSIKRFLTTAAIVLLAFTTGAQQQPDTDQHVQARRVALEMAGAFSNDGFKIRDGHWTGQLPKDGSAVIAVNLYAGNHYWFSVGTSQEVKGLAVHVHDEHGKPVAADHFEAEDKAAAGFSPTVSGQYFVSIHAPETPESTYCLVYSYR
jgi:hypothetical protein